ncbi:beta-1,2-xylosyltransferase XYXT1-like [Triticum urartu]|uniref:Glycosyltransferase 61 catalytic domain-containing protein n=1 Tax=Triticum urartu TaxID=4572 RepID=A0A8R7TQK4_TRIUA|nr:beta-1,2-xylosyltransferase XYXT1-like [Triticum urartu]XP_048561308.1 beta-1,2-xylosyltransferase XYXT1-like [Triticum urartu]
MGAGEGKHGKGLVRSWAQRYLNLGFVAGFLLVLLAYIVVTQQFVITSPEAVPTMTPHRKQAISAPGAGETGTPEARVEEKAETKPVDASSGDETPNEEEQQQQQQPDAEPEWKKPEDTVATEQEPPKRDDTAAEPLDNGKVVCTTEGPFSDTCDVFGDVRTNGTAHTVTLVPATQTESREWKIQPYARRTMSGISEVTVTQLDSTSAEYPAPACTVTHNIPGIVFALGGLTGNYFHDFSDALVPLFIASRRYGGEVQLLASNIQPWWLGKYEAVVRRLSKYDVVDLDHDDQIRCFPSVTVGLRMHKEFDIVPELVPGGTPLSMVDFTAFLRETYSLPRVAPVSLMKGISPPEDQEKRKPRLMLLHRGHYRKFVNVPEIVKAAENAGFEVAIADPRFDVQVEELARSVNSFDVLLGVHGAGLTNAVFMPTGAVVIQVVPYGNLERMAKVDFGDPVADMGLRYLEYSITSEESTLLEMLGPDHPVIKDPESVHRSGWDKVAEYYLGKQDVRVDVERFAPTLALAIEHLRQK